MKALELDNTLAEAHTVLAEIRAQYDWDWPGAEQAYKRAIELNPSYAFAHAGYGNFYLAAIGRGDEALAEHKRALELDPLSIVVNHELCWAFFFARQYDQAIEQGRKTLEMDPNFVYAHQCLGANYRLKGM